MFAEIVLHRNVNLEFPDRDGFLTNIGMAYGGVLRTLSVCTCV